MIRKITTLAIALVMLAAGCASAPKPEDSITILVGPDGKMTAVSTSKDPESQAAAALMSAALNGELTGDDKALTEDQIWQKDADGNVTHIQSGAICAAQWGAFTRNRIETYIKDGTNVGCNYGIAGTPNALTFYIYEGGTIEEELDGALEAMKARQPVSKETPYHMPAAAGSYQARTLAYETADKTAMRTSVLVAQAGRWILKMRLTCPAADAKTTEQITGIALMGQTDRLRSPLPPPRPPAPV